MEKLNQTKYAYVIYDYDANNIELKEILRKSGKHNKEQGKSINCGVKIDFGHESVEMI